MSPFVRLSTFAPEISRFDKFGSTSNVLCCVNIELTNNIYSGRRLHRISVDGNKQSVSGVERCASPCQARYPRLRVPEEARRERASWARLLAGQHSFGMDVVPHGSLRLAVIRIKS
jgi:hypothetical protein